MKFSRGRRTLGAGLWAAGFGLLPLAAFGGIDINLITGAEVSPNTMQFESVAWGHGDTVVVVYTDSRGRGTPATLSGLSVSTDGGATFNRVTPSPFTGFGDNTGSPSVFYSRRAGKWFVSSAVTACGGKGVGQWESIDGLNWAMRGCIPGEGFERPTTWVDNNPGSPFYGRQYVAFNDYSTSEDVPQATYSVDDGVTWSAPVTLFNNIGDFRRALKVTGSLGADGTIFVQTLSEGGGGLNGPRRNFIYRSTDGGVSFTVIQQNGQTFLGPGRSVSQYFAGMYSTPIAGYWIEMGWGQPGVGPDGVVHYAYAARTASPSDPGDIYYIRSADNGTTWSSPLRLNTDTTTRAQWNPSLAVNARGRVSISWYDERNTTDDSLQRFHRTSLDNGASWQQDEPLSDVVFPKPLNLAGSNSFFRPELCGTYNHAAFSDDGYGNEAYHTWVDGRVAIGGQPQHDIFFDKVGPLLPPELRVTTIGDHDDGTCSASDCTLREAINAANAFSGDKVINFGAGVTGTIQLSAALPELRTRISVEGPGADLLTVRRNSGGDYRIFTVTNSTANGPVVSLSGLTIANGYGIDGNGGGIFNDRGTLTVSHCAIVGNRAFYGGGICNTRTTSGAVGLLVNNSTLADNQSPGGYGGGIYNVATNAGSAATATLTNSTLSNNSAAGGFGGAIYNGAATSGNAQFALTNCTLSGNSATGGIYNFNSGGTSSLTFRTTILRAGSGANLVNSGSGSISSGGFNLSDDNGGGLLTNFGDISEHQSASRSPAKQRRPHPHACAPRRQPGDKRRE